MYTSLAIAILLLAPAQQDPGESVPILSDIPLLGDLFVTQGVVPDPDLRWDGETEEIYRRAMHLIQVRAKYRDGANLLISIADTDEVIQIPGQSSWVLGQAALALAQAGALVDAEALVPGIVNGSRGTDLEPQVGVLLQRLSTQLKQDHQQLDETFRLYLWDRLTKYPTSDQDRGADIIGYGRQVLPYLQEITRSQLVLGAAGHPSDIGQAKKATYFAQRLATEESAMRLYALLQQYPPLTTSVLLSTSSRAFGDDVQAQVANSNFYLKMVQDADPARAQIAASRLVHLGQRVGGEEVMDYLWNLAQEDNPERVAELAELVQEGTLYKSEDWTSFVTRCAESGHGAVGEAARWGMVGLDHHREDLRRFVEQGGERRDQLRYLACFTRPNPPGEFSGRLERAAIVAGASEALSSEGFYRTLGRGWPTMTVEPEDYRWIIKLSGNSDPGVAATAFTVALDSRSDEVIKSVFMSAVGESKELFLDAMTYGGSNRWEYDADAAHELLAMAAAGSKSAHGLLAASGMDYLSVAELVDSGVTWSIQGEQDGWDRFVNQRYADEDHEALADLAAVEGLKSSTLEHCLGAVSRSRSAGIRAVRSVSTWTMSDVREADQIYSYARELMLDTGNRRSDFLPEDLVLDDVEHFIETVWQEVRAGHATAKGSRIIELINRHWISAPERAYELGLRLVKDEDDLQRYIKQPPARSADSEWTQRLNYALVQSGAWDLNKRGAYWFNDEQPEFEPLMRAMFDLPSRREDALDVLSTVDHKWLEVFAADIDAAWTDPELWLYVVQGIYLGTPEIKDVVPQLLGVWDLEGIRYPEVLLAAMGETLDERVVPILLDQLGSANEECRAAASAGLERMREVREQREFWEAWEATGSSLSPTVALIQKLKSDKQEVRIAAIQSLGTLKAPEALPFLVGLLEDSNAKVRAAAAAALAKINAE